MLLTKILETSGYRVKAVVDGKAALTEIKQGRYDLLVSDIEMPRMNGIELTTHIRANEATRNLPVIMVTSRTTEKHRHLAEAAGIDSYMTKPYRDSDLLLLLRSTLSKAA